MYFLPKVIVPCETTAPPDFHRNFNYSFKNE